jgi:hypothetical protein
MRLAIDVRVILLAEIRNDGFASSDIPAGSTEGLRERTHHDIDFVRVDAEVVADTTASWSKSADRVRFIDV